MSFANADRSYEQNALINGRVFICKLTGKAQSSLLRDIPVYLIVAEMAPLVPLRKTGSFEELILGLSSSAIAWSGTFVGDDLDPEAEAFWAGVVSFGRKKSRFFW